MKKIVKVVILLLVILFSAQSVFAYTTGNYGGDAVRYVKNQKPGGYNWDILYQLKDNKGNPIIKLREPWVVAKDLWIKLWVHSAGATPKVNSVMVLDKFSTNLNGHVAIVMQVTPILTTKPQGYLIQVKHSNWEAANMEAIGWFKWNVGSSSILYSSDGKTWKSTTYPLLGFIYVP